MKKNLFLRIVFYVAGLLILALGIILNTKSGLGVSPIISVAYSITTIGGFNFGNITFLLYSAFVVVEIVLHIFRNHRYSGEAGGAIAPAAHRDLKLVLVMDLLQLPLSLVFTRFMNLFSALLPKPQIFRGSRRCHCSGSTPGSEAGACNGPSSAAFKPCVYTFYESVFRTASDTL